ncbi:MAG: hypothetical protein OHK0029_23090 [Armatimonadaceae bacterium]
MPSPVAEYLIRKCGYRLLPLPFADALKLRDRTIHPAEIPAYAYGGVPPVPAAPVPTVGTRLLLVAGKGVPEEAVARTLEVVLQSGYLRRANLPPVEEAQVGAGPEMPLHPGATRYLRRNNPLLTSDLVQDVESLRSFLVSAIVGGYLAWRALRKRRYEGFDAYLAEVTALEKQALELEAEASLNLPELIAIRNRLSALKTEALEKFTDGHLRGEDLMSGFLAHVADVRNYLTALILAERERIAEQSADSIPDNEQEQRFIREWQNARKHRR